MDVQRDGYRGNGPPFQDRAHAGALPANRLEAYRGKDALILGIPRGGVPVAAEVAHRLGAELDVVVARKLPATISPELAIGAVTANGGRFLNEETIEALGISDVDLERVMAEQRAEARRREERFRDGRPLPRIEGRTVVVVDDGLATGATIRAALRSVRRSQLRRLVAAVPVGSRQAVAALCEEAHEVVCLVVPSPFLAVGLYYGHFEPTEDADVQRIQDERRATGPCPRSRVG